MLPEAVRQLASEYFNFCHLSEVITLWFILAELFLFLSPCIPCDACELLYMKALSLQFLNVPMITCLLWKGLGWVLTRWIPLERKYTWFSQWPGTPSSDDIFYAQELQTGIPSLCETLLVYFSDGICPWLLLLPPGHVYWNLTHDFYVFIF